MSPPPTHQSVYPGGLAWRLGLALASIVLALGVVSTACIGALMDIHHRLHTVKDEEVKARNIVRLASAVRDQYAHVAHTIILGNDSHAPFFRAACQTLERLANEVSRSAASRESAEAVTRIVRANLEIQLLFENDVLPAVRHGRRDSFVDAHERILKLAMQAQFEAERLADNAEGSMEDLGRHVSATQHRAILITIIVHALALATAILVGVYLYRSIARPIRALAAGATRVAGGDLETSITIERADELGHLAKKFNEMTSALKAHQAKLLQTEKLAGLGRLAAGIAHELNNPIAVISGYAKLLCRRPQGAEVDPRILGAIDEEAERCRQVIEGLLQLTRGGPVDQRPVQIRQLIEGVVARLGVGSLSPGLVIELSGSDLTAMGDAVKLGQVFTNLICNAAESSGPEGRVQIALRAREPGLVEVTVHDEGPGVRPENREQIFEPLFTTKSNGTGLGLPIARAIMRAHGGDLTLSADATGGATFIVNLPRASESRS